MNVRRALSRAYRMRLRLRPSDPVEGATDARLWADVGADPRAHLRCGQLAASDGAEIPYRLWRAREARAAVLLLHGAFDYSAAFDEIGPRLARRGFTALAFDQRGFGATASRGTWSGASRMTQDACEAAGFLLGRMQAGGPLFLLGESMGGAVAMHAAASGDVPQLKGLVLAAPGALASAFRQRVLALLAAAARGLAGDAELVFERLSGWELTPAAAIRLIGDPLVMRRIRPDMLCGMADLAFSSIAEAANVRVPALTMVGDRDEIIRRSCIRRLFDTLGGEKTWRVVPEAPHLLLHWRRSNEVLREVALWMSARLAEEKPAREREQIKVATSGNIAAAPCRA
ncbi:MAG TPA: alpha/beta fold hydrolase [Rhizomicrobium sp.]|jgi:alpha-beta hydrolase superfamily lysophospholipase|nr:alpha/beta fold hydrolase [Rhizomicrobium sp.]